LIRSSWGSRWGDNGNGWLPVAFLRKQLARDCWTLVSEEWLESGELSRPAVIDG
jgi:C1A family cysteine protease